VIDDPDFDPLCGEHTPVFTYNLLGMERFRWEGGHLKSKTTTVRFRNRCRRVAVC
jgi:hypothetical protein